MMDDGEGSLLFLWYSKYGTVCPREERMTIHCTADQHLVIGMYVPPSPSQAYFTLTSEKMKFVFPNPYSLEGVKSLSKSILKMMGVTF